MQHDAERPQTTRLITESPIPEHLVAVLQTMRANPFTRLSVDEVRSAAARILIVSPSPEVARLCCADLTILPPDTDAADDFIEVRTTEEVVPSQIPAGTWVFLPHRQDGWTELESASAKVRAALVRENTARSADETITLIEYGINLWLWAEPPYSGGDPVCHAGELISWESAWTLTDGEDDSSPNSSARPPIYFGLPEILRRRRAS